MVEYGEWKAVKDKAANRFMELGLRVIDNIGDGNCLFHALSQLMDIHYDEQYGHEFLRKHIFDYAERNDIWIKVCIIILQHVLL